MGSKQRRRGRGKTSVDSRWLFGTISIFIRFHLLEKIILISLFFVHFRFHSILSIYIAFLNRFAALFVAILLTIATYAVYWYQPPVYFNLKSFISYHLLIPLDGGYGACFWLQRKYQLLSDHQRFCQSNLRTSIAARRILLRHHPSKS